VRNYGLGRLWGIPAGTNPTPVNFAVIKDVSLDIGGELDVLRGEKMYGIDAAKKGGKAGGKIGVAQLDPKALSLILTGVTRTSGTQKTILEESGTIPTTPFQITVAQSATWVADLGVLDTVTGLYMTRGATATGTGVYAVAAGVYTFNTADNGHAVKISYRYSVAGSGATYTVDNSLMTTSTAFGMDLLETGMRVVLPAVHIPKLGFGLKGEGWNEFSLDYEAVADAAGKVAYLHFDEG
jgi:hypothetical protein